MNKNEILFILFLYTLIVLISSSRIFLSQIASSVWFKNVMHQRETLTKTATWSPTDVPFPKEYRMAKISSSRPKKGTI
jgi:hypothetical protein